jgi:hypothetical protein
VREGGWSFWGDIHITTGRDRGKRQPGFGEKLKGALWYYLHKQPWDPDDLFEMQEPLIYLPERPLNYYRWVWEMLFEGQESRMPPIDDDHFVVV